MEKSVRCDKSISKNERKGVEDGGESWDVVGLETVALRKKSGSRVGGSRG